MGDSSTTAKASTVPATDKRVVILDTSAFIASDSIFAFSSDTTYCQDGGENSSLASVYCQDEAPKSQQDSVQQQVLNGTLQLVTVPQVIGEIMDSRARQRYELLSDFITLRDPTDAAMRCVIDFSKATGDFVSLSTTDIRVMALAYTVEFEKYGSAFLKQMPKDLEVKNRIAYIPEEMEKANTADLENGKNEDDVDDDDGWTVVRKPQRRRRRRNRMEGTVEEPEPSKSNVKLESEEPQPEPENDKPAAANAETNQQDDDEEDEEDGKGWINPDNIEEYLAKELGGATISPTIDELNSGDSTQGSSLVSCMTTDYAMQNVLLQMGIKIMSLDGRRPIQRMKRYILVCESCNFKTRELDRQFCRDCGNASLVKVAYGIESDGTIKLFINSRRRPRVRGTKYSIPKPKGGRNNSDLILSEDQLEMRKMSLHHASTKSSAGNVDILDPNSLYNPGAKYDRQNDLRVGYGRRNPNTVRKNGGSRKKNKS